MEDKDQKISRTRFLGLMGAYAAFASGCSRTDRGRIVARPKPSAGSSVPGVAEWFASTFQEGELAYSVLVKAREGRPIHVQGNDKHPRMRGRTALRAVADVLRLYDPDRLRGPMVDHKEAAWDQSLKHVKEALENAAKSGRKILLLTDAVLSPARAELIERLRRKYRGLRHVAWEPASPGGAQSMLPRLRLDRADIIVSFDADFLNARWPDAITDFSARRRPEAKGGMNRLYVLEGGLSVTGSNADHRIPLRPSQAAAAIEQLAGLMRGKGKAQPHGLTQIAQDLGRAGKRAIVIAGPELPAEAHAACRRLNDLLGAVGYTVEYPAFPKGMGFATLAEAEREIHGMAGGEYGAAIFWRTNPLYAFPDSALMRKAMKATAFKAALGLHEDETAHECEVVLPESHWLEAWGDYETDGALSLQQPVVEPLYDTRQGEDVLLDLLGAKEDFRTYLEKRWKRVVYSKSSPVPFDRFWQASLHEGFVAQRHGRRRPASRPVPSVPRSSGGFELLLKPGTAVYDGRYANSGWLQELPDPVSKKTWGNVAALSPTDAKRLGVKDGDLVQLDSGGAQATLPALVQKGQVPGLVAAELGYGRRTGTIGAAVGANLFPLLGQGGGVKITRTGARQELALTQREHGAHGRDIVRRMTLDEHRHGGGHHAKHELHTLNEPAEYAGSKWAMAIDLSACVGCGACVVACQAENNIPNVGPEEVRKGREMHWMRIDRYYEGSDNAPKVAHQPMLCQHCDDAPCETVCPVNATNHSPDGLNQMVYNRCVGTRYCANNCPYKVRRFNFFDFTSAKKEPESMVYNPEVTLRPRGVMEKCTFCVQRIQDVKQRARGRDIRDGEVQPACAAACPAKAIVFGDANDKNSAVAKLAHDKRGYKVLEELGARPSVTYLAKIENPKAGTRTKEGHGH
ncbi:MAG: 4Fe-4S dicluster domain-containing protein [Elusimicrobiota bacterium]